MDSDFNLPRGRVPGTNEAYYIPDFVTQDEEAYLIRRIIEAPRHKWKQLANRRLQTWGGEMTTNNILIPSDMPAWLNQCPDIIARLRKTGAFASSTHGAPNHVILNEYLSGQGIMPHQDGPAYHPVVGTISLGSPAVFHYYEYKQHDPPSADSGMAPVDITASGRTINPVPVLSVLLEPRSLIITTSSLYSHHLHGIEPIDSDVFSSSMPGRAVGQGSTGHHKIANIDLLQGLKEQEVARRGGVLNRRTRYSLTCRDVEKVANTKFLGKR
ncbi:hypothetical protein NEOLEDRAFT_1099421 [Neolentinus lepideus HHB14362 ss-1]|uniref:Fe2OG dioxygenase domain-containing protein n=1 Tax=Neolentinus lepideus HHB14362 ss-1 TaxID=1314782 RepID=A0A165PN92_9AGAM|nr:hypothetical protein NEOLEDRAFT_1099421 [Neolentinus lepideus HHB14362 ss-1]